jgi:hypothetical protein
MKVNVVNVPEKCPHGTLDSLMSAVLQIIPGAIFEEDNHGQIVIYTDLQEVATGKLESFVYEEKNDQ